MKRPGLILSSFVVVMIVALLAGGGGITYILHTCQMCDISTSSTLSVLNPPAEEDACCGGEMEHNQVDGNNLATACCDFRVEQLKIDNFVFSNNIMPDVADFQLFTINSELIEYPCEQISIPVYILNKHGGRFIVNSNCQLLT